MNSYEAPGMLPKRVIPCLDVAGGRVVKGTEFVDIRDVGDPVAMARHYEAEGADELVFLDISATAEQRSTTIELVRQTAAEVSVPFTVGGGIRSETDAQALLDAGADKIAVNSAALADPILISKLANRFGKQCVVLAVDARRDYQGSWEVYVNGGTIPAEREVVDWVEEGIRRGAGEILLTSIDRDGTREGYDLDLLKAVTSIATVPVIASGGAGRLEDYDRAVRDGGADAVLAASMLHSGQRRVGEIKAALAQEGEHARNKKLPWAVELPEGVQPPTVAIVDYGVGNRHSVQQALQRVGAIAPITADGDELAKADGLVLPGVGAYPAAMQNIRGSGLDKTLNRARLAGKPILGICLGHQLLFEASEEGEYTPGLGYLAGAVQKIDLPDGKQVNNGLRPLLITRQVRLSERVAQYSLVYNLHSYAAVPADSSVVFATLTYSHYPVNHNEKNPRFISGVQSQNIYGVQFHPEKSGAAGLRLLRNFVEISANTQAGL